MAKLFQDSGLDDDETRAIDVDAILEDFDDFWTPFLGGVGPAPAYYMSLDEDRRSALRDRLRDSLPSRPDGSIPLIARAWAVPGSAPA